MTPSTVKTVGLKSNTQLPASITYSIHIMADPRIKTIKIQTGVIRRLTKDKISYEKESEIQTGKVQKYKEEGQEEHYVKKQEEVLQESKSMVFDCQRRLLKAFNDFKAILDSESDLSENEDYINALQVMEDAKPHLPDFGKN
ncbi:hypothetical protein GE061_016230 [Apolygus lucorum]|uniref:Tubulin-specific chaperone A n=1 Tax=Apolygus lucorum TaxID=248454 RepID=A0A8S9XFK5_APOLU|nr:hypothetical protein GE061_016230 [Apolygus lucorum]